MAITHKMTRITPEMRFKIKEMIDKKFKHVDISRELKINNTTLYAEFKRSGVNASSLEFYDPVKAQQIWDEHMDFSKRRFRKFSDEEQCKLDKMVAEGRSVTWMARELWCGIHTIKSYFAGKNVRVPFGGLKTDDFKKRVETLEQQVTIILDILTDMQKGES